LNADDRCKSCRKYNLIPDTLRYYECINLLAMENLRKFKEGTPINAVTVKKAPARFFTGQGLALFA
jgi:hypothetical protein